MVFFKELNEKKLVEILLTKVNIYLSKTTIYRFIDNIIAQT